MTTKLLDLGNEFEDTIMQDRSIDRKEYDTAWEIYNVSSGLSTAYVTLANAIYAAIKVLTSPELIVWAKAHVAYLQEQRYSPALPAKQAEWKKMQDWAAC